MSDRDAVLDTITRLFWHTDHQQWEDLVGVFTDDVHLDYTSLQGGEPTRLSGAAIVNGWKEHFATLATYQHLVSNHLIDIDGDTASVRAEFIATHQYDTSVEPSTWQLGGDYRFALERSDNGWAVNSMIMNTIWQTGSPRPE